MVVLGTANVSPEAQDVHEDRQALQQRVEGRGQRRDVGPERQVAGVEGPLEAWARATMTVKHRDLAGIDLTCSWPSTRS
jgi:hypothetical protein